MRRCTDNGEAVVLGVPQSFKDSAQPVSLAQRDHGGGHDASHREQVQVLDRYGFRAEEGDALDLQQPMIEWVGQGIRHPLGHHDADQEGEQHPDITEHLHNKGKFEAKLCKFCGATVE